MDGLCDREHWPLYMGIVICAYGTRLNRSATRHHAAFMILPTPAEQCETESAQSQETMEEFLKIFKYVKGGRRSGRRMRPPSGVGRKTGQDI